MQKIFIALLLVLIVGCKTKNSKILKESFPFGFEINQFKKDSAQPYSGGDCWGSITKYYKDDINIYIDSTQCSEYYTEIKFILLTKDSLQIAHDVLYENYFNSTTQKLQFITTETIYSFSEKNPSTSSRIDTLNTKDHLLIKKIFSKNKMDNPDSVYSEFKLILTPKTNQTSTENNIQFTVSAKNPKEDPVTLIPSVDIYISSAIFSTPIFLTKEFNLMNLNDGQKKQFEIPTNSSFSFWTWWAGGGACYYGIVEGQKLKVFKKYLEEQESDNLQFELLKTISLAE